MITEILKKIDMRRNHYKPKIKEADVENLFSLKTEIKNENESVKFKKVFTADACSNTKANKKPKSETFFSASDNNEYNESNKKKLTMPQSSTVTIEKAHTKAGVLVQSNDERLYITSKTMTKIDYKNGTTTIFLSDGGKDSYKEKVIYDNKNGKILKRIKLNKETNKKKNVEKTEMTEVQKKDDAEQLAKMKPIDGKIGKFSQGNTGDCWVLAGTQSLSETKKGADYIKSAISRDSSGNVIVELKGSGKKYVIKPKNINEYEGKLSKGDANIRAIELAIEAERIEKRKTLFTNLSKKLITMKGLHNYHEILSEIGPEDEPLKGGFGAEVFTLLTGKKSKPIFLGNEYTEDKTNQFYYKYSKNYVIDTKHPTTSIENNSTEDKNIINKELNYKMAHKNTVAMETGFRRDINNQIVSRHAYAVKEITKDSVTINNPWHSEKDLKMSRKDFLTECTTISEVRL